MPDEPYQNFDLLIERTTLSTYRARVLASPAGEATTEFTLPFSAAEQTSVVAANWSPDGLRALKLRSSDSATPPLTPKAFGERLFGAVFQGELWTCLSNSLLSAKKDGSGLRITLRLNDAPELATLPWEYLRGPSPYDFFALSQQTPLVRYPELLQPIPKLTVPPPLRIVVLIADPSDIQPRLAVEDEWQRLSTALAPLQAKRLVKLERLPARLDALQTRLQERKAAVHLLHFIGHGAFDPTQNAGGLLLEDANGRGQFVSGEQLGALLYDEPTVRLVFLNACEGARSGSEDLFAGVAQTLVRKALPAVIAMQYRVTDRAAINLAASFYQAIANGFPVDGALAEARKTLYLNNQQLEWGTPVLFLRAPDGMLFLAEKEQAMSKQKPNGSVHINTGGGNYIDGNVHTGGGDFVGRNKTVHGDEVRGNKVQGDMITAKIGDNASNIAVGKQIQQTLTEGAPATMPPAERLAIEQCFTQMRQQLAQLDAKLASNARIPLQMLEEELLKTDAADAPNADAIIRMGDWLLKTAPELIPTLSELFGLPVVSKTVAIAGPTAVTWVQKRFG